MKPDNEPDLTGIFPLKREDISFKGIPQGGDATIPVQGDQHEHVWHISQGAIALRWCERCGETYILTPRGNNNFTWKRVSDG